MGLWGLVAAYRWLATTTQRCIPALFEALFSIIITMIILFDDSVLKLIA